MARRSKYDTAVRILAIAKMLNEGKKLSSAEIIRRLDLRYDIQVDRKTIISDISEINRFFPVDAFRGPNGGYMKCDVLGAIEDGK